MEVNEVTTEFKGIGCQDGKFYVFIDVVINETDRKNIELILDSRLVREVLTKDTNPPEIQNFFYFPEFDS